MQRAKLRKLTAYARNAGMGRPAFRKELEDVLIGCHNGTARAQLRARIMRGVPQ